MSELHRDGQPVVVVEDLVKRYDSAERNAVDHVSLRANAGELFALLGPNGAGKTTIISILTTTLAPTAGRVTIAGHDVERDAARVRAESGIIFQQPSLDLNLSAEENIRLHAVLYGVYPFRPSYRLMPERYRHHVGLLSEVVGLGDELFRPVRTFSGGMRRKLEIVRSLIHRPRILFLDEPSTGLDPKSRRDLWSYLRQAQREQGTTLFLTTHYLEEAERADRICIISRGRVVSRGTPEDVKADLVERYLVIDAEDRAALKSELSAKGIEHHVMDGGGGALRIDCRMSEIHGLLQRIEVPLSVVQTHIPTLEDAYLAIVERTMEEQLGVPRTEAPS